MGQFSNPSKASSLTLFESATVATTSGSSVDFTGIPANARKIKFVFDGVSVSTGATIQFRMGDSGGFENSGYVSNIADAGNLGIDSSTSGFIIARSTVLSTDTLSGEIEFELLDSSTNTWLVTSICKKSSASSLAIGQGSKSTSATMDRIQLRTDSGSFDAGKIKLSYFTS
jgi:hypothetical protein